MKLPFSIASLVIPPWVKPVVYVGLATGAFIGVLLLVSHHDHKVADGQKAKDSPMVIHAGVQAVQAQTVTRVAIAQAVNASTLTHTITTATQKADNAVTQVQDAPDDDAAFRAYLAGLHDVSTIDQLIDRLDALPGGPKPKG